MSGRIIEMPEKGRHRLSLVPPAALAALALALTFALAPAAPAQESGAPAPEAEPAEEPAEPAEPAEPSDAAPEAPAPRPAPGGGEEDVFVPSEEIGADEEITFPVDI